MHISAAPFLIAAALFAAGCEDGPDQIFTPNTGDPEAQNGGAPRAPFVQDGDQDFASTAGQDDNAGRARFCSEKENQDLIQQIVQQPIIPDVSIGGVPMWSPEGSPVHADDLVGRPEDGKFCDPTVYSNALTWGPLNEVIAFIDTETRLLTDIVAYSQYLGDMNCSYTEDDEDAVAVIPLTIKLRERIKIGEIELDQYTSRANQASRPRGWLNNANINLIYRAVRETFFDDTPPAGYDCLATKVCNTFYATEQAQEVPQGTQLYFVDSELVFSFSPDGVVEYIIISPVRGAPFAAASGFGFGDAETDVLGPTLTSISKPGCAINMAQDMSWGQFKQTCIGDDQRTLDRANYDVYTQRDAVAVGFRGVDLTFQRRISESEVFHDGERPKDSDMLASMTFTRISNAPVAEFVPKDLAWTYRIKLLERIRGAVTLPPKADEPEGGPDEGEEPVDPPEDPMDPPEDPMDPPEDPMDPPEDPMDPPVEEPEPPAHPLLAFTFEIPESLSEEATPLEQMYYDSPAGQANWNNAVIAQIQAAYDALTPAERAMVDPKVIEPTWIIEPFVETVMEAFTHGQAEGPTTWWGFRNTDDRKWVIGYVSFLYEDEPYRMVVQYSLNYGAVTAVTIGRGFSEIDEIYAGWNEELRSPLGFGQPKYPFYGIDLSRGSPDTNPFALGGDGIRVNTYDRQLGTLEVKVTTIDEEQRRGLLDLVVAGDPIEDRNGYLRQIRGERYEWVPANVVRLSGRENGQLFYLEADNRIGRVAEGGFKRPVELCPGLAISYGDDIRKAVQAYVGVAGVDGYRECEIVFNYSDNGNVLDAVASLTNRVSFVTVNGRAVQADVWR